MKKLLLSLVFILSTAAMFATTFYVSTSGNDANSGTIVAPFKTLSKAVATVRTAGDIIHVNAGTFTESQSMDLAAGVSIEGDNKTTTIIKGNTTGFDVPIITMQSPDNTNGNQHISNLTFDGQYVSASNHKAGLAIWITGRSNVSIYDCIIKNFWWRGVIYNGINTDNPGTDAGFTKAIGNTFYNNTVTNCADYGISGGGSGALNIGFQKGMLIYNNFIQQNERPEGLNGWPIKYWNQGWIEGVKIYNNTLIKKPYGGTYPGESGWDFAIEFFNIMGLEIYGNNIQNGAIDLSYSYKGSYAYSVWIHDNNIHNPVVNTKGEGAIILEFRTESALIENNTINNKTYGISFNTRAPNNKGDDRNNFVGGNVPGGYSYVTDCIIRNNLLNNMYQGSGIVNRFGIGVISEGTDDPQINNMQMYNNTIIGKAGSPSNIGFDFTSQPNGKVTGVTIKDNIIVGFANESIKGVKAPTQSGVNITNNCYWNNPAPVWPSATITGNFSSNPNFDANYVSTLPIGYKPSGVIVPPPVSCTSWTFGAWSACNNGVQTRVQLSSSPLGCVGNAPTDSLTRSCTIVLPPSDTTYCTTIQYGDNLTRRVAAYFVKRQDGFFYDNNGVKRAIKLFKSIAGKWYFLNKNTGNFEILF